jgi:non-ribosomal peptide synthetase component E (peptide arylation enzyme)
MGTNLSQAIKQYGTAMSSMDAIIEMQKTRQEHAVIRPRLSFREFDRRIDQYITKFSKKGIRKGSRALMLLRPRTKMMCTFFARVRMGPSRFYWILASVFGRLRGWEIFQNLILSSAALA